MNNIEQRELNLFNATETMAQFYDEIESFLSILHGNMERLGFAVKADRLRSGTITVRNLTRRLLATVSVTYVKDSSKLEEPDVEEEEEAIAMEEKPGKDTDVTITRDTNICLLNIYLFDPKTIPSAHSLSSPLLLIGAISEIEFVDKKTNEVSNAESHTIGLSNLGYTYLNPSSQVGNLIGTRCWKPKNMKKFKMQGKLIGFESMRLLEIDSQDKIKDIAKKLTGYCS